MNREIKFRGKRVGGGNTPDNWFYGNCLIQIDSGTFLANRIAPSKTDIKKHYAEVVYLCQFTGLKDKNDKDIYEGDIVRISFTYFTVTGYIIWQNTEFACYVPDDNDYYDFFPTDRGVEIIGNIYDNPEILNKHD